jgi:hypothetical protein
MRLYDAFSQVWYGTRATISSTSDFSKVAAFPYSRSICQNSILAATEYGRRGAASVSA